MFTIDQIHDIFRLIVGVAADWSRLRRDSRLVGVGAQPYILTRPRSLGGTLVISQCLNSECRRALYYLGGGRVVRTEFLVGMRLVMEHFWLCDDCSQCFDFLIFSDRPAVAIRCERHRQRFVRTAEAASLCPGETLKENVGPPTVMTQLGERQSDHLLSRPRTAASEENGQSYLLDQQATSEHFDSLPNIRA